MATRVQAKFWDNDPQAIVSQVSAAGEIVSTTHGGNTMVWRIWGIGEPLVLIHGGYGSWTHWIRNVDYLSQFYRVIVPDLPGFGDSPLAKDVHSLHDFAGVVASGLDQLLPNRQTYRLVGFSFGSAVASHLLPYEHKRIARLVIVATSGLGPRKAVNANLRSWRNLPTEEDKMAAHRHNLGVMMIHKPEAIDPLAVHLQSLNTGRARTRSASIPPSGDRKQLLAQHPLPLAGIWGDQDAMSRDFLNERLTALKEIDPESTFAIIPSAGHWVQYEAADAFNEALRGILLR